MRNFCTLFDSTYLTRGLALYHSLQMHCKSFRLYVYCFDDTALEVLAELALPDLVTISLAEFENNDLLSVKQDRTRGEYCWTCTAHTIRDAIMRFDLSEVTYLDSDMFFFASPDILLNEFRDSGSSVLITEHRYSPHYDQSEKSGIYCVQFMTFKTDKRGMEVLEWWCDRTLEWCYNRYEDGKFGDQKYLDDWTERFEGVHVLQHSGGGVAPWNVQRYTVSAGPMINDVPLVFYHFHNLGWCTDDSFLLDRYRLSRNVIDLLYRPYIAVLKQCLLDVRRFIPGFEMGRVAPTIEKVPLWKHLEHRLKGKFHVIR